MSLSTKMRRVGAALVAVLAMICLLCSPVFCARNVILMIGDGMGFEHVKAGSFYVMGKPGMLCFERFYKCSITTHSLNADVTDSAAAGTAMATGHKVANGVISQSPAGEAYETILETAKRMGKRTGLVTTVPITHATPAAFGAHEASRNNYYAIGNDFLSTTRPNVLFGGGDPEKGGAAYFSNEMLTSARSTGYQFVSNISQLAALDPRSTRYALGLFAGDDLTFESNRSSTCSEPHLAQMTRKALAILAAEPKGFFLMVEGGAIDHGAHAGNIAETTGEVVAFNGSVQVVLDWMKNKNDTLLIVTADHETGGLTVEGKGIGIVSDAKWSTSGHTGANVPFYATGADSNLVTRFVKNGAIDNTDIYRLMLAAYADIKAATRSQ